MTPHSCLTVGLLRERPALRVHSSSLFVSSLHPMQPILAARSLYWICGPSLQLLPTNTEVDFGRVPKHKNPKQLHPHHWLRATYHWLRASRRNLSLAARSLYSLRAAYIACAQAILPARRLYCLRAGNIAKTQKPLCHTPS